jgi:phosphatidylglycerophosphate synthase
MIILDASKQINGKPIGLEIINDQIWIVNFLEILRKAGKLDNAVILTHESFISDFQKLIANNPQYSIVKITSELPSSDNALQLQIDKLYVRRNLTNRLRKNKTNFSDIIICQIDTKKDLSKVEDFLVRDQILIISRYINMPIARRIALWLKNFSSVSPNQVSTISFLTCITAVGLIATGEYLYGAIAALVLQIALTLDLSDGYLARLTNKSSKFGAWFDTMLDEISTFGIIIAFIYGVYRFDDSPIWICLGIFWIISVHTIATNFWYTKATNFVEVYENIEEPYSKEPVSLSLFSKIKRFIGFCLGIWQSLDGKFYVYSLALLLDQKKAVILLMALERTLALILIFKKRFSDLKIENNLNKSQN